MRADRGVLAFIAIVVVGLGGAVLAFYKFASIEQRLGSADITIKNHELARLAEHLLDAQVSVSENTNYNSMGDGDPDRHLVALLELKNSGSQPIQIGGIELKLWRKVVPEHWENIHSDIPAPKRPPAPPASEAAPPAPDPSASIRPAHELQWVTSRKAAQDLQLVPNRVGLVNKYLVDSDGWSCKHAWVFDPKKESGDQRAGIILVGQKRHISFDLIVQDGNVSELLQVALTISPPEDAAVKEQTWRKQYVRTVVGLGPAKDLFPANNKDYPSGAAPEPAAPAPEAPPPAAS